MQQVRVHQVRAPGVTSSPMFGPVLSCSGTITASVSGRYYFRVLSSVVEVIVSLATPGSTDTLVYMNRDATPVQTITLPGSQNMIHVHYTDLEYTDTEYMTVAVTPGSGAADLVVETFIVYGTGA